MAAFARVRLDAAGRPGPIEVLAARDDAELEQVEITKDGRTAALIWNVAGRSHLAFCDLVSRTLTPGPELPAEIVFKVVFSKDGRRLALSLSGAASPADIWVLGRTSAASMQKQAVARHRHKGRCQMRQIKKHMAFIAVVFVFAAVASISMQASNSSGVQASPLALTPRAYLPVILKAAYFPNAGNVQFFKQARSDFDPHTTSPSPEIQAWMRDHYWRMLTYAPYFDTRLSWYPTAWAYKDLYGIYTDTNNLDSQYIINNHPEWILKDSNGNRLYINWGCHNSTCPQYAGDVGNPAFRTYWITQTSEILSNGYIGLFVDDVNLDWRISDGDNNFVTPIDPRTGTSMTLEDWQRYFAEFTEQIRMAFPNKEIVHNVIWYAGPTSNSFIRREIQAADYINLERGVNDGGLVGGNGNFGLETFFAYIDYVHSQNRRVLFLADKASAAEREYGLAGWLLISEGNDGFSNEQVSNPDNWWIGYELDLGAGFGTRYKWNSVIRRDFERGLVLLNQPHMPTRTIQLGQTYQTIEGNTVSSVTLDPATGVILRKP